MKFVLVAAGVSSLFLAGCGGTKKTTTAVPVTTTATTTTTTTCKWAGGCVWPKTGVVHPGECLFCKPLAGCFDPDQKNPNMVCNTEGLPTYCTATSPQGRTRGGAGCFPDTVLVAESVAAESVAAESVAAELVAAEEGSCICDNKPGDSMCCDNMGTNCDYKVGGGCCSCYGTEVVASEDVATEDVSQIVPAPAMEMIAEEGSCICDNKPGDSMCCDNMGTNCDYKVGGGCCSCYGMEVVATEDVASEDGPQIVPGLLGFVAGAAITGLGVTVFRRSTQSHDEYNEIVA